MTTASECTCSVCGARQPLIATLTEPAVRAAWESALALWGQPPADTVASVVRYLDWLAAPGRAPQARTVARALADLGARIGSGQVAPRGQTPRPATLAAWVEAMDLITSGQTEASRPLTSHAYLIGIVWRRAGERRPAPPGAAPAPAGLPAPGSDGPPADRAGLIAHLDGLRALLPGARSESAGESLRRQIADTERRLSAAGDPDGQ